MSFILSGNTLDASYVGDCDIDWNDPKSGSELTVQTEGELDTLTRPYMVRLDRKSAVQTQLGRLKGKKDFEFTGMVLEKWTETEDGPFVIFNVTFRGLYDGKLPRPKISGGMVAGTLTVALTSTLSGLPALASLGQKQISYLAPTTTWKYVTRGIPTGPQYAGKIEGSTEVIWLKSSGASGGVTVHDIQTVNNTSQASEPTGGRYNVRKTIKSSGPTWDQFGPWCQCSETSTVVVEPFDHALAFGSL